MSARVAHAEPAAALRRSARHRSLRGPSQEPLFTTMQEFDAWMADEHAVLTLDGNW